MMAKKPGYQLRWLWRLQICLLMGAAAPAFAQYAQVSDAENPFLGISDPRAAPSLADFDADGDLDMVLGTASGALRYFENTGSATAPVYTEHTALTNPLADINTTAALNGLGNSVPSLLDLNGDNRADLLVGYDNGQIYLGLQTGLVPAFGALSAVTAEYGGVSQVVDIGDDAAPLLTDVDSDGDIDIVVGGSVPDGSRTRARVQILYSQGPMVADTAPKFIGRLNDNRGREEWARPAAADVDGDGDLDLLFGVKDRSENRQYLDYYEARPRTGEARWRRFGFRRNPFGIFRNQVAPYTAPAFADIDGDGDIDLVTADEDNELVFIRNGAAPLALAGGIFDAVDVGASAVSGALGTVVSGQLWSVDIVALLPDYSDVDPTFVGSAALRLLDARDDSGTPSGNGCLSSWPALASLGTAVFDLTSNGRVTVAFTPYLDAIREAAIEITDLNSGTVYCSRDGFSIRPASFTVVVSDDDVDTPGISRVLNATTASGMPVHSAGAGFTVRVSARNALGNLTPGWDGTPELTVNATVLGANPGALSVAPGTVTGGVWRSDGVSYGEVGAFTLEVKDSTFASVDAGDTPLASRTTGPETLAVGRFVPADFAFTTNLPALSAACGNFSYLGEPVAYRDLPEATLVAVNASGVTTTNYTGTLMRLDATSLVNYRYEASNGAVDASNALVAPVIADNGDGSVDLLLESGAGVAIAMARTAPTLPFTAEIALRADIVDLDGVTASVELQYGDITGTGIAFDPAGSNSFRFGRMSLINEYASELHPLDMPVLIEHYADLGGGASGFVTNANDCLTAASFAVGDFNLDESGLGDGSSGQTAVSSWTLANGIGNVRLTAPGAKGNVAVTHDISTSAPWLLTDGDNDGNFDDFPAAVATFGIKSDQRNRVYQRERLP